MLRRRTSSHGLHPFGPIKDAVKDPPGAVVLHDQLDAAGAGWFQSRAGVSVFGASSRPFNGGPRPDGDPVARAAAAPAGSGGQCAAGTDRHGRILVG